MTASVTTNFAFFRLLSVPYPSVPAFSAIPASIPGGICQIIAKNGKEHYKQILRLSPRIEKQACCQQKIIFQCLGHDII